MKTCSKCKETKEYNCFCKNNDAMDGLTSQCKSCLKEYRLNNVQRQKTYWQSYKVLNRDKIRDKDKRYNDNLTYQKKQNKKRLARIYQKNKKINDQFFKFKHQIISLIGFSIRRKGYTKKSRTHEILGCSYEDFKIHIERQFTKGMTWDNRDKWHIDHIIPMATAKTEEDVIRLNHYTNLRPLWAEENLSKSDKIITHKLVLL